MGSRPTAVDLSNAIKLLKAKALDAASTSSIPDHAIHCANIRQTYIEAAEKILEDDYTTNLAIGRYGAEYLRRQHTPVTGPIKKEEQLKFYTTSPPGTQGLPAQTYRKLSVLTHCNTGYAIPVFLSIH
jgi:methylthioribose-1-phosphate isomerase